MRFKNLYVHTPFCETKCHYCDFFSLPESKSSPAAQGRVYDAILNELDFYPRDLPLDTVFLGGGTPSLAPLLFLEKLFSKVKLSPDAEVTLESNPSSVSREKAARWKKLGVNRVSLGIQALSDERLIWLGRAHSKNAAFEALEAVHDAGFERVSADYIVGVPGQSAAQIQDELHELLSRFPKVRHVSAYLLTLKSSNPHFGSLPDENTQLEHLRIARDALEAHGLLQYEVSNFSLPGLEARHNENYWLGGSYLGIGPSAHSFDALAQKRWKNWASLGLYCECTEKTIAPVEWSETLTLEQQRLEYLLLRLRRRDGIPLEEYNSRFGTDLLKTHSPRIQSWAQSHWIQQTPSSLRLVKDGFFLSDSILEGMNSH